MNGRLSPGHTYPLGATMRPGGVNFCIFSKNCTALELLLFERVEDALPARVIQLDPQRNRTFYYWHVFVPGISAGQLYAYRAHGSYVPELGRRYDGEKVLLDPYARAVAYGANYSREAAARPGDNCAQSLKGVVVDPRAYDWEGDAPLQRPSAGAVWYELHVGGFSRHASSSVAPERRGTYAGLIDKVPYLKELGVSAVELLPVQQFDEQAVPPPRKEYWGYNPIALFAPHHGYSARRDPLGPVDEFRDLVKALHRAGIEVILDVVFNHTGEAGEDGPTLSFRGLEDRAYYLLEPGSGRYLNFSGCGNTVNGNHSIVRRLILDCLRYWVQVMHVDGFRFDLASVLARDEAGQPLRNPPVLWSIESDPVLAGCKIIAEAWDAAGLYQVGNFIGHRWAEWNGRFRDDVRRFIKGDADTVRPLACRILSSPDLYSQPDRDAHRSINFVTCHDGFTLHDLVSYDVKHNEENGECNRDGRDVNFSWNCGVEGPTDDPAVFALRARQMKNLLTILMLSQGTPMLLMGDEVCRTQRGNNNAYCQDNGISWLDWRLLRENAGMLRFVRGLIRFRREHVPFLCERIWSSSSNPPLQQVGQGKRSAAETLSEITWHGVQLSRPDWDYYSHSLAFSLRAPGTAEILHVLLNAYWEPLVFELPLLPPGGRWRRVVDTALPSPQDLAEHGTGLVFGESTYVTEARSAVVLLALAKRNGG